MDDWAEQRLAELEARAPIKRAKTKPYVKINLDVAARAFAAVNCPKAMVYLWLAHQARKTGKKTITVPNAALTQLGVSRRVKHLALQQLERAGLISVEWRTRKNPIVTLLD